MGIIHDRIFELVGTRHGASKELAQALGISPNNITNWKAGRSDAYKKYLPQIAGYYGVSLDWLSGKTDIKQSIIDVRSVGYEHTLRIARIMESMREKNMIFADLSKQTGISVDNLMGYVFERSCKYTRSFEQTFAISEALGKSASYLLGVSMHPDDDDPIVSITPEIFSMYNGDVYGAIDAQMFLESEESVESSEPREQKENPPAASSEGKYPEKYNLLNETNKAIVDRLIADLAKSQSNQ